MTGVNDDPVLYAAIPGGPELVEWFGCVPGFHDAEIVSITINRRAQSSISVHAWNTTREVDARGYFVLAKHAVVTFVLEDVMDVQLDGFSAQNVISGLKLRRAPERPDRSPYYALPSSPDDYEIELEPCYGLDGRMRCKRVSISFAPGKPDDVVEGA